MNCLNINLRIVLILVPIFFLTSWLIAQEDNFNFCEKVAPWENFVIDSSNVKGNASILIVSNRMFLPNQKEFLINDIGHWRLVNYFLAYCESDKWHLTQVDSLEKGLKVINKGEDVVLFVHGHGKTFPEAISRSNLIKERYNVDVILFDWPSENKKFNYSHARVRHCSENFYNLLIELKAYRESSMQANQHLNLFAHSLGNYFLVQLVLNGNNQYLKDVIFDNVIMNSAAIKTSNHDKVLSQIKIQKKLYIIVNENDMVLRGAQFINFGKMLGNYALPSLVPGAEYIHFTDVAGKEHTFFAGYHLFEYTNLSVFDFYNTVFHGLKPDLNKQAYYLKRATGDGYNIVPKIESLGE